MLQVNLAKIIEHLSRNYPSQFNVNQIARVLKISVGSAHKILKLLNKKEILKAEKVGNGIYYTINLANKETEHLVKLVLAESRNRSLSKRPDASIYAQDLEKAKKLSKAGVLFGSIIEKKDARDVDVLFIIRRGGVKKIEDFCSSLSRVRPKRINPILMTSIDLRENLKNKDEVVLDIFRKGIILFGEDEIVNVFRRI